MSPIQTLGAGFFLQDRENEGKTWARNQRITHLFPMSCQQITHPHNISSFPPSVSPQIVNKSAFYLHVSHFKSNILSTYPQFVNALLSKDFGFFEVGCNISIFCQHLPHITLSLYLRSLSLLSLFYTYSSILKKHFHEQAQSIQSQFKLVQVRVGQDKQFKQV